MDTAGASPLGDSRTDPSPPAARQRTEIADPPHSPPTLDPVTKAMSAVHEHIQATKLKVSQIFSDLDSSGDGVLDAAEFRAGIRKILDKASFTLDASMIKSMFKKVDQDGGGSIDWKEFLKTVDSNEPEVGASDMPLLGVAASPLLVAVVAVRASREDKS